MTALDRYQQRYERHIEKKLAPSVPRPQPRVEAPREFRKVTLTEGINEHCERARAAGATIVAEPEDQFYGDRVYRALDPEGHVWNFNQEVGVFDADEMHEKMGLKLVTTVPEATSGASPRSAPPSCR